MAAVVAARTSAGYVQWGSVIAGAVVASALSFVLLTAGATVGLSLVSPYPTQSYGRAAASVAAFWLLVVPILSLLVGGYIAGRMRSAWENADADEVEFRDGVHGLLVWSLSIVIGGALAFLATAATVQVGANAAQAALSDRSTVVASAVDTLLATAVAQAEPEPAAERDRPAARTTAAPAEAAIPTPELRREVAVTLANAVAAGELRPTDRQALAQIVAQRTGLSTAEAEKRVDLAYAEALALAEKARKATVVAGLVTVTALLFGLAAAWYAGQKGGQHRDNNIPARFNVLPPRRRVTPGINNPGINNPPV
jgi:hypothetical protein